MSRLASLYGIGLLVITILLYSSQSLSQVKVYDETLLSAEDSFRHGLLLRGQFKHSEGLRFIQFAADSGHADGAFVMAIELLKPNTAYRNEVLSKSYMLKAAEQGSLSALAYLFHEATWVTSVQREKFAERYINSLIKKGKHNPQQAYWLLSEFYSQSEPENSRYYLDLAMEFESPRAYLESAQRIATGEHDYLFEAKALREINSRYLFSANAKYLPGIKTYIRYLEEKQDFRQAYEWRTTALKLGDITSLVAMANIYGGGITQYSFVEEDKVKSAAYCATYLDLAGKDRFSSIYKQAELCYLKSTSDLTKEDKKSMESIKREMRDSIVFYHHDKIWDTVSIRLE